MLRVGIGVGVLVLLLFFVGIFYRTYRQNSGLAKLRSGIVALQSGNTAEAITQLATATGLLSKEERGLALIYLGDAYTRLEKREEAEAAYQELAQRSEGYLTQMALLRLGRNAEGRQDFQLARQCYEKAAALEGPFQSEAVFAVARVLDSGGERSAASAYYERVLTQYPDSPLAEVARQKSGK